MNIFNKKTKDYNYDDNYDNNFYRADEEEDVVDDEEEVITTVAAPQKKQTAPAAQGALKVVKPHSAQDGLTIADYLMHGYTVVMNIEELDRAVTIRLIDFLQGALHVLDGELRRVTKSTFVLSPRKGEVSEEDTANGEY